jgi:alanyl-tRNA synthetase
MSTERLYYANAYLTSFTARVLARDDDGRRVYLDRTALYPTSGGQPRDTGCLNGITVVDVIDEDERIAHLLAMPLDADFVRGEVDWERRFDHMQQHSGQHLLSAIFADVFGYETVSVHFGATSATLDLAVDEVPAVQLVDAERRANALVAEGRPIDVSFEDARHAAGLRKAPDRGGLLRIVTIDAIDRSACGGTHVRATSEIGAVLLRRQEKVRKATRLEFLCGGRAVSRARADHELLATLAQGMSASVDELAALVPAQGAALHALEAERRRLHAELSVVHARAAWERVLPDARGLRRLVERRAQGRVDDLRPFAQAFAAQPQALLVAAIDDPPTLLVAASGDSGMDAGRLVKDAVAAVGGRGGGSPRLAQGSLPSRAALDAALESLGMGDA